MEGLHRRNVEAAIISALQVAPREVPLPPHDAAVIQLAYDLTRDPEQSRAAVNAARAAGLSDEELADAVLFTAFYNMLTRVALGFGHPPDRGHPYDPAAELPIMRCTGHHEPAE